MLPDSQRLILLVAEMLKNGFLQQSAFDEIDMFCVPDKQVRHAQDHGFLPQGPGHHPQGAPLTESSRPARRSRSRESTIERAGTTRSRRSGLVERAAEAD